MLYCRNLEYEQLDTNCLIKFSKKFNRRSEREGVVDVWVVAAPGCKRGDGGGSRSCPSGLQGLPTIHTTGHVEYTVYNSYLPVVR